MGVAGIVCRRLVIHHVPHIGDIRQFGFVERLKDPCSNLPGQEITARYDNIIPGAAGQQLGFQYLVGIEGVVDDLDPRLLGKLFDNRIVYVIRPIVDVDDFFLCLYRQRQCRKGDGRCRQPEQGADHDFLPF